MKKTIIIALAFLFYLGMAQARTFKVPEMFSDIQEGVNAAEYGDVVEVAAGTFKENIQVKDGVTIRGSGIDKTMIEGKDSRPVVEMVGSSLLTQCTIQSSIAYPGYGVFCSRGNPTIQYCKVTKLQWGVGCFLASPTITKCDVVDNTVEGFHCVASYPTIQDNKITGNGDGIYCCFCFSTIIERNEVQKNRYIGIYCISSSPTIVQNTIAHNMYVNVLCNEFSTPIIRQNSIYNAQFYNLELYDNNMIIDARSNYWGTTVESQIKEKIWDGSDQKSLGRVLFKAWYGSESAALTAPAPEIKNESYD